MAKNMEETLKDTRAAFEEMNRRHRVSRAFFFSQKDFRRQLDINSPIGLCAGLVQTWWAELRKGNDAIRRLKEAAPELLGDVLLSQARSIYLKEFPPRNRPLRAYEAELLKFKYGEDEVSSVCRLFKLFGVNDCLELDLTLLHEAPLLKRWQFSHLASDVVNALGESPLPGLYVLLVRYWDPQRASGESGHRTALAVEAAGSCRFYDPRWGEMSFPDLERFAGWFAEYWTTQLWDYYLQRGTPPAAPLQLFALGGTFAPSAAEKSAALRESFSSVNLGVEELLQWLDGLRALAAGERQAAAAALTHTATPASAPSATPAEPE